MHSNKDEISWALYIKDHNFLWKMPKANRTLRGKNIGLDHEKIPLLGTSAWWQLKLFLSFGQHFGLPVAQYLQIHIIRTFELPRSGLSMNEN